MLPFGAPKVSLVPFFKDTSEKQREREEGRKEEERREGGRKGSRGKKEGVQGKEKDWKAPMVQQRGPVNYGTSIQWTAAEMNCVTEWQLATCGY